MDFSKVKSIVIPEGNVTKITDTNNTRTIWQLSNLKPVTVDASNIKYSHQTYVSTSYYEEYNSTNTAEYEGLKEIVMTSSINQMEYSVSNLTLSFNLLKEFTAYAGFEVLIGLFDADGYPMRTASLGYISFKGDSGTSVTTTLSDKTVTHDITNHSSTYCYCGIRLYSDASVHPLVDFENLKFTGTIVCKGK